MNENYSAAEKQAYLAGMRAMRQNGWAGLTGTGDVKTYTLTIREVAPDDEVRNALQRFAANYPMSLSGTNSRGEIILWSSHAWNVGYLKEDK